MNYANLIKSGLVIRIEDSRPSSTEGFFDPAEFWNNNGQLSVWTPEIGIVEGTLYESIFNGHIEEMLSNGLDIIIKHRKDLVKEYRP